MTIPLVAIVILNWKQCRLTLDCLNSISTMDYPIERLQTIVVDNNSMDDSVQTVRDMYPGVTIIENTENLGYAGGNNVGIRYALERGADYICILNNDVLVSSNLLQALITPFEQASDVAVATPLITDMTFTDRVWALGARVDCTNGLVERLHVNMLVNAMQPLPPFSVDVAPGSAMLIKAECFTRVGLLDADFFLYYEEGDWCLTLKEMGYRIIAVPQALVQHKVSATVGTSSPLTDYYMIRNRIRFIRRHWHGYRMVYVLLKALAQELWIIFVYTIKSHRGQRIPGRNARLRGIKDAILNRYGPMNANY